MQREKFFNLSMFILRTVLGIIFIAHGGQKLFGFFNGIGIEGTAKIVEGFGFRDPYLIAAIWANIEFLGGVLLVLGVMARWAALSMAVVTFIYMWKVGLVCGFFIQDGGIEYYFLIIGACMPLIFMGGGSWSVWDV